MNGPKAILSLPVGSLLLQSMHGLSKSSHKQPSFGLVLLGPSLWYTCGYAYHTHLQQALRRSRFGPYHTTALISLSNLIASILTLKIRGFSNGRLHLLSCVRYHRFKEHAGNKHQTDGWTSKIDGLSHMNV
ncbi:hypothetical protein K402DRAFT_395504 [Aulographum hederae CBS 113979]|uniref:Uncharacterized protein n=1 Tax=Aulographum hederae CBS 113979 TaxID=1176131 RepID=A0A6G1GV27_9PEZI|nr:hypothetical protein K402DRAFT_395504 [Aulographum hederae CBS 113979]